MKFIEALIILSTDLEITIGHHTLTNGDAVLCTFVQSDTITEGELK